MMDYGIDGLNQTLDKLKESGIRFFGAGVNRRQAGTPYHKRHLYREYNGETCGYLRL